MQKKAHKACSCITYLVALEVLCEGGQELVVLDVPHKVAEDGGRREDGNSTAKQLSQSWTQLTLLHLQPNVTSSRHPDEQ